ncbi:MAG: hypothetical protein GTO02_11845 [Candidatus Dadabacteria bacterium]|nr:hypothetical protein [Candidatus Dadabacteria bacterium]
MQTFHEWALKKVAKDAKIDINKYDIEEIKMGMEEELEHGTEHEKLDVTGDNPIKTLKIVIAHLKEDPKYYTKLKKIM